MPFFPSISRSVEEGKEDEEKSLLTHFAQYIQA